MSKKEMINLLVVLKDYMKYKDESPLCAMDIQKIIDELKRLWDKEDE